MRKLFLTALAVATFASCSKEGDQTQLSGDGGSSTVSFTSGIASRASGVTWHSGDTIGVFMSSLSADTQLGVYSNIYEDGTVASFSSDSPLIYPSEGSVDFLAYYPYNEDVTQTAYAVDVTDQSDLPSIDLMTAVKSSVAVNTSPINMTFSHRLSSIEVTLSVGAGFEGETNFEAFEVMLVGSCTTANYNISTDDITDLADKATITFSSTGLVHECIAIPQVMTDAKLVFTHSTHGVFEIAVPNQTLETGKIYRYSATISATGDDVVVDGSDIDEWDEVTGTTDPSAPTSSFSTTYADENAILHYISTAADLNLLSDMVGGNNEQTATTYEGVTFIMTDDIDFEEGSFAPIGNKTDAHPFSGTFDGNGKAILNFKIDVSSANQGFFAYTLGATIKNVTLSGSVISSAGYVGGFVGYAQLSTLLNCHNNSSVDGGNYTAGIAGLCEGTTIENCVNSGAISSNSGNNVGGIAGNSTGCNTVTPYSKSSITNCYNVGTVYGGGKYIGGISGQSSANGSYSATFTNCYNAGAVTGGTTVGAVIGYVNSDKSVVTNCYYDSETSAAVGLSDTSIADTTLGKETTYMQTANFVTDLAGDVWAEDTDSENDGYPILTTINYYDFNVE